MRIPSLLALVLTSALSAQSTKDLYDLGTLRTANFTFSSGTWYSDLVANRATGAWLKGNLAIDGRLYQQIGVRMTGNNSYLGTASQKKSLAIKMDEFIPGQDLLGYDNVNLHNGFNDPTFLREVLGYQILRKYMPAPKCNFMKVFINNAYWGLYVNVQQIDKGMIDDWFMGNDGNRYLAEPPNAAGKGNSALQYLGPTLQSYKDAYDLKNTATAVKPWEDVRDLANALNNSTQIGIDLPKLFDVDQALWYLAYYNLAANLNGYNDNGADYFLYHDEQFDLLTVVPWDMAGAFGASANQTVAQATGQSPFLNETKTSRPLLGKLWGQREWRARYIHHMKTMLVEEFNWAKVQPLAAAHVTLIDAAVKADTQSLYGYQNFVDNLTKQVAINSGTYAKTVPGLKQFLDDRLTYLAGLNEFKAVAPTITNVVVTPPDPRPNTSVIITAKVTSTVAKGPVMLHYQSAGGVVAAPMFDDGMHGDGQANDGVYGAIVPTSVHTPGAVVYYFIGAESAVAAGGAVAYEPTYAATGAPKYHTRWAIGTSPIKINELMPDNTKTIKDSANEFDDWLELYNSANVSVTVAGMFLTDDVLNPTKFKIPDATVIASKGTLLIWCDEDASQGKFHANFKLSATNGEEVILFDTDGKTRVSTLKFGPLDPDVSNGWLRDGDEKDLVAYRFFGIYGQGASPGNLNEPTDKAREYWPLDYTAHRMFIEWVGQTRLNQATALRSLGGPPNSSILVFFATGPAILPFGGGLNFMLSGLLSGPYPFTTDPSGQSITIINIPNDPNLVGLKIFFQCGGTDSKGFTVSNGGQVVIQK